MRFQARVIGALAVTSIVVATMAPVRSHAGPWRKMSSVEKLATEIDRLECHIENYGTIVAKQPDVWGQSRLTKYRQDFEYIMAQRLDKFAETINASIARSDQAFLASALALQSAASGTPAVPDATKLVGDPNDPNQKIITRTAPFQINQGSTEGQGIKLEPTVVLDQAARYLDHLNELRRVNDGDDTADSPGYGLHLIRLPISVLPGKKTTDGFGAEVTVSIQPYLSDELLPSTYRNLVVNDVIDLLALGITKVLNEVPTSELKQIDELLRKSSANSERSLQESLPASDYARVAELDKKTLDRVSIQRFQANVAQRRSRQSLSSTQMSDVFGGSGIVLGHVVVDANRNLRGQTPSNRIHLPDVEGFLKSEIEAAYDFLSQPESLPLWERHCTPRLSSSIRLRSRTTGLPGASHPQVSIQSLRDEFFEDIKQNYTGAAHTTTVSLAWAILVEAALLNERLVEDIRETSSATNCQCVITDWMPFYLPKPPAEACFAFNQYVRCRWPVHVFALDPVMQDQNVADSFSRRREMQLALSLAFASGQIGANSFTRFARRLELDMETIALNRTIVGFSHGNETFGWRFYPRVQSPPTDSNLTVVFRDLLVGGPSRNAEIRKHRLEPGIRECVALVIMPAFVPYVTIDVRSNWFSLVNPQKKLMNLRDAAVLSESIQSLHASTEACIADAYRYRDGDVHRLIRASQQLESRLPLQSAYVQVPFENTLGGFEMFNTGVTDLAPELHGFYGEPGVTSGQATEVFLVGDHFNVHETKVIAGTKTAASELLSQQVMRVVISGEARAVNGFVDVQVATPYGVSKPLSIPLVQAEGAQSAAAQIAAHEKSRHANRYAWGEPEVAANVTYDAEGRLAGMCLQHSPVTVVDGSDIPFPAADVDLACWVNLKKKDGTTTRLPNRIVGPLRGSFSGGRLSFASTNCKGQFADALLQVLQADPARPPFVEADEVEALVLEGFVRAVEGQTPQNAGRSDGLPVIRIEESLTIRLQPCPSAPCAPTHGGGTPFDASPPDATGESNLNRGEPADTELERPARALLPPQRVRSGQRGSFPHAESRRSIPGANGDRSVQFGLAASKPTETLPAPSGRTGPLRGFSARQRSSASATVESPRIVPIEYVPQQGE